MSNLSNVRFPVAAALRTPLAVKPRMRASWDKSVIVPVSDVERVAGAPTTGFNQGGRLPRGVPR